jgi:tetratricopeptide (TPR) repeat protein
MFKSNWIFGVGLDRYGSYFKEFREPEYGLRYGFEISSNNAHNIPLQLFATGGILTGVLYLALIALVLFRSVKYLKLVELGEQKIVLALLSGWIGYLAQAIISIDNIGVSIWGWLLAGSLLGVSKPSDNLQSFNEKYATSNRKASVNVIRPVTSILATVFMSVLCFNIFQSESNMYKLKSVANSLPESKIYVEKFAEQVLNNKLADPTYQAQAVDFLLQAGYLDKGNLAFNKLFNSDPRNLSYLQILAENEERLANYTEAIKYRNLISKYDPWNAQNYLDIIDLLIKTNNINKANEIKNKLTTFAADTEYSKIATEILRNS